jgi:hypothetical protein
VASLLELACGREGDVDPDTGSKMGGETQMRGMAGSGGGSDDVGEGGN